MIWSHTNGLQRRTQAPIRTNDSHLFVYQPATPLSMACRPASWAPAWPRRVKSPWATRACRNGASRAHRAAPLWTFVSALFVSQIQRKPESHVFWCGLADKESKHPSNTTLNSETNALHPVPFRLLERGTAISFYIFLFISGYILSHQLITEYRHAGYISISNFYLKRFLRIFPLLCPGYFLYRLFRVQGNLCKPWTNALFINNFFEDQLLYQCFDNSWIISVFMQLFLILPWLILAMFISLWSVPDEVESDLIGNNYLGPKLIYIAVAINLISRVWMQIWSSNDSNYGRNGLMTMRCQLSSKFYYDFSPFLIGILFSFNRHREIRLMIKEDEDRRHHAMIGSLSPVLKPSISPQRIKKLSKAIVDSNFLVNNNFWSIIFNFI